MKHNRDFIKKERQKSGLSHMPDFFILTNILYCNSIFCDIIKRINKKEVKNGTIRKVKRI